MPITNTTGETIHLTNITGSCTCGQIEPTELVLAPSETKSLRLSFDLRGNAVHDKALSWAFQTAIWGSAKVGDKLKNVSWTIRGNVKRVVRPVGTIDFGPLSEISQFPHSRAITIRPIQPAKLVAATVNTPLFGVAIAPGGTDQRAEIVVTTNMKAVRGKSEGMVTLKFASVSGVALPLVQIPVRAEVVGDVEMIPASIIASGAVGTEHTETLNLRSLTNATLQIEPVSHPQMTIQPIGSHSYIVKTKITEMGSHAATYKFRVRINGMEPVEISVPVSIYGQMP